MTVEKMNKILVVVIIAAIAVVIGVYVVLSKQNNSAPAEFSTPTPQSSQTTQPSATQYGVTPSGNSPLPSSSQSSVITIRYKTASFVDSQGIGIKAFSMRVQTDWESSGEIK